MSSRDVVLGGYPAKQCARAVHNSFSPTAPERPPVDAATQRLIDDGLAFEQHVNARLAKVPGALLLSDDAGWSANTDATLAAMRDGVPLIINGRLPNVASRTGAPDLLVRAGDGYLPVDVKNHGTRKDAKTKKAPFSTLDDPGNMNDVEGRSDASDHRDSDCMQLAHYTRMLQELGLHAGDEHLVGGIIGNDDYTLDGGDPWLIQWYDLATAIKATYSASSDSGRAKRSLLERYDHEFAFRLKVAREARAGGELVRPFHVSECGDCAWKTYCTEVAGPEDVSFAMRAGLPTAQQWRLLYDDGITTVADLADPDLVEPDGWDPRDTQPGKRATDKFATLTRRARMTAAGRTFEPLTTWPTIPSADVEIDFDIEWDLDGRIYMYGLRIREGHDDTTAVFDPVVRYEPLDDDAAAALADEFAAKLGAVVADAEAAGRSVAIYHWTSPETTRTARYPAVAEVLRGRTFDLERWFAGQFLTLEGTSIKVVAPLVGFHWSVEDAGGAESQLRIEAARSTDPAESAAARAWLHSYNESDVAAQAAIRDGLRRTRQ